MVALDKLINVELDWDVQKKNNLVLHPQNSTEEIAVLSLQGRFASKAEGKWGEESWKLKRAGMRGNISISKGDAKQEVAFFKRQKLTKGTLTMQNGKTFQVERNAAATELQLFADTTLLIACRGSGNTLQVFLQPAAIDFSELPLLVIFLAYWILTVRIDAQYASYPG